MRGVIDLMGTRDRLSVAYSYDYGFADTAQCIVIIRLRYGNYLLTIA